MEIRHFLELDHAVGQPQETWKGELRLEPQVTTNGCAGESMKVTKNTEHGSLQTHYMHTAFL